MRFKKRTRLTEALIAGLFFLPMAFANVEIKTEMKEISENYTTLGKQIDNPALNTSSKEIIDKMISSAKEASDETPARAEKIKDPAKAQVTAKYKTEMGTMIAKLEEMKMKLDSQDNKGAREAYNGLKKWTKPEHAAPYK